MNADVLIIEDDFDIRQALAELLEGEGYRVAVAEHGAAALKLLREARSPPSLILLDLMMPVMNGWQFVAESAGDPALAAIPVYIISADEDLARKASELGVLGWFRKPVELDAFLDTVAFRCGRGG